MIKANELRIGNWIERDENEYEQVDGHFLSLDMTMSGISDVDGVRLTPKILEAAGFECTYNSKYKQSYDHKEIGYVGVNFHAVGSMYDLQGRAFARYYSEQLRQPIEYVHQLQNLYFALTGEELEINFDATPELNTSAQ